MKLRFEVPEGFEMPPDAEVGGEFQAVGTFQDNGDGTLTLLQIDGADVSGMVEDEESGAKMEIEIEAGGEEDDMEEEKGGVYGRARRAGVPMRM